MVLPIYLAMTFAQVYSKKPDHPIVWMGASFSSNHTGLSNLPEALPPSSVLLVDDRIIPEEHDPERIIEELLRCKEQTCFESIILDFQNPYNKPCVQMAEHIAQALPCSVAVTPPYKDLSHGPILLPPHPPDIPFDEYTEPYSGRELWLEVTTENTVLTLTESGCTVHTEQQDEFTEPMFTDEQLCCSYHIKVTENNAVFSLFHRIEDLEQLSKKYSHIGLKRMIGLYDDWMPFYLSTPGHRISTEARN